MKIFDEHGTQVGEIESPGPVENCGCWYEPIEYRPKNETDVFACDGLGKRVVYLTTKFPVWIFKLIPRATPEQLKAIGMRERDDSPTWLECGDVVWNETGVTDPLEFCKYCRESYKKWGWVLVPVEKEPDDETGYHHEGSFIASPDARYPKGKVAKKRHSLCHTCGRLAHDAFGFEYCPIPTRPCAWIPMPVVKEPVICSTPTPAPAPKELDCPICQDKSSRLECPACGGSGKLPVLDGSMLEGKTVTAPALKVADEPDASVSFYPSWMEIHTLCCDIGMKPNCNSGQDTIIAFIRSLAQRAGEGYTVEEIYNWLGTMTYVFTAKNRISDPQTGIKAVINRRKTKND